MSNKAQLYVSALNGQGFNASIDPQGNVTFQYQGGTYVIFSNEDDAPYFRLVYPSFWAIENDQEHQAVVRCAAESNANMKVAKIYPVGNDTWASVELLFAEPQDFQAVLQRSLSILQEAVDSFCKAMKS